MCGRFSMKTNRRRMNTSTEKNTRELQTVVDKGWDHGEGILAVCCTSRGGEKSRRIGFSSCLCPAGPLPRRSRQPECPRRGPAPCLPMF
ncbi:hypothetical protein Y032_0032g2559 [Ancylostoma ceylanicum]|nr:hypothetical protein Y032_0032g2559 [Ancylostoma ceylanicum]